MPTLKFKGSDGKRVDSQIVFVLFGQPTARDAEGIYVCTYIYI